MLSEAKHLKTNERSFADAQDDESNKENLKMKKLLLFVTIGSFLCIILTACSVAQFQAEPDVAGTEISPVNMPNPASVYCVENGNKLEIQTAADGSQSGVCVFPDGSTCDEWAYFRGECGPTTQESPTPAATVAATQTTTNDGVGEDASGGYMLPGSAEAFTDWWGVIKSTEPGAQYNDYFERQDLPGIHLLWHRFIEPRGTSAD